MFSRRRFIALVSSVAFSSMAQAGPISGFAPDTFAAAQAAGKPILVHITAGWCPTCRAQKPIVKDLSSRDSFKDLLVFEVDFDAQNDVVAAFGANTQSTLIVFKGNAEVDRSIGETDPSVIEVSLSKAITAP